MQIEFRNIDKTDRALFERILTHLGGMGQEYSFEVLYLLSHTYDEIDFYAGKDGIIIRFKEAIGYSYLPLCSDENMPEILSIICNASKESGFSTLIITPTYHEASLIERLKPGFFDTQQMDNFFDYVYLLEDFAQMEGKRNQHKRNKIHKFSRLYPQYRVVPITSENMHHCIDLLNAWDQAKASSGKERSESEYLFCVKAFEEYALLKIDGDLLMVEDTPVSLALHCTINPETIVALICKQNILFDGADLLLKHHIYSHYYQKGYKYVNFCDDNDSLSLRAAKERLHPTLILYRYLMSERKN